MKTYLRYTRRMMRQIAQSLVMAFRNFSVSKMRTLLTILGIVIGIAAVFLVMSIGASAQQLILSQIRSNGSNLIGILPGASDENGPPASVFGIVPTTLTSDDLDALINERNIPHIVAGSGYVTGLAVASFRSQSVPVSYQGVSATIVDIETISVGSGRFFDKDDGNSLARVAVLGSERARDLFGLENPIGKRFSLQAVSFSVIGVLEERGGSPFSNPDQTIYIPLETAQKLLLGIGHLNAIRLRVDDEKNIPRVSIDIRALLRDRHDIRGDEPDDFSVRNTASAITTLSNITNILKYFLAFVAGISLFVGGIGIMNIMLIALKQRIREVGLRKALGARDGDILLQFLVEAILLSLAGGIFGFFVGVVLTFLVSIGIRTLGYEWEFILTFQAAGVAMIVSILVGVFFGLSPARHAARISPMEALRYE